jgi:photosystem II stability/assembly factor-like uncharacterized protein
VKILSISTFIASAVISITAGAQTYTPVSDVKPPESSTAIEAIRTITISPEKSWVNVGENERVKFVADGVEQIVNFGQPGSEKLDIGGRQITVYIGGNSQFSSPGD